ncbi:hypothetical protein RDABS01_032897 [Bienertia sinuspersici]
MEGILKGTKIRILSGQFSEKQALAMENSK